MSAISVMKTTPTIVRVHAEKYLLLDCRIADAGVHRSALLAMTSCLPERIACQNQKHIERKYINATARITIRIVRFLPASATKSAVRLPVTGSITAVPNLKPTLITGILIKESSQAAASQHPPSF